MLVSFGSGPLTEGVTLSLSRFGVPSAELIEDLDVRTIARADDPGWFDSWRQGALRAIAVDDLGEQMDELDQADHAHVIVAEPEDPDDLGYLQAAWGMARYLVARGATVVLDVHAMTFHPAAGLPEAGGELDVTGEVRLVFEGGTGGAGGAHALHTRGLRKFGAPDLVALCGRSDAALVGDVLSQLADVVARGVDLATPRHGVEIDAGISWYVVDDQHGLSDLLQLDNDARVLVDADGQHLIGVLDRLRAGAASS